MDKNILIAKIVGAHGIKGEVKILYFGDNIKNLEKYPLFDKKNTAFKIKIITKDKIPQINDVATNKLCIAKIEGVSDRNQAELLKDIELFTNRKYFSKPKKNEFYISDLIGLEVFDASKQRVIGKIINIYNFGASPIIEIEFFDDFIPKGFQKIDNFLFKNDFFPEIDIENNRATFSAPEVV